MQILITGGFGYIGSQILDSLSRHPDLKDCHVVVVDNWSCDRGAAPLLEYFKDKIRRFSSYCLDVSDASSAKLRELVGSSNYVVSCASLTRIPNSPLHERYILGGARNLAGIIAGGDADVRKVVEMSSASIYGPVGTTAPPVPEPYAEDIFPDPETSLHDYAASKLRAEKVWRSDEFKDIPSTILRMSTVFGYAVGMRYNQFINQFLVDAGSGREAVLPGSPADWRPFVHVKDAAGVVLHLLTDDFHTNGHVINIGASELNPRLGDLFEDLSGMLRRTFGIEAKYSFAGELGENALQESYKVDFSKFRSMVNFSLQYDFESGARELVERVTRG